MLISDDGNCGLTSSSVKHTCTPVNRIRKTYMHAVSNFHARFFSNYHTMSEWILPQDRRSGDTGRNDTLS